MLHCRSTPDLSWFQSGSRQDRYWNTTIKSKAVKLGLKNCSKDSPPLPWKVEAAIREVEIVGKLLLDAASTVCTLISDPWCISILIFLCYLSLFTQASMNLRSGHNVTQVDFDSKRTRIRSLKPANGYAQVKETFGSSVQDAKTRLTTASQKI